MLQTSSRVPQTVPDLPECHPTCPGHPVSPRPVLPYPSVPQPVPTARWVPRRVQDLTAGPQMVPRPVPDLPEGPPTRHGPPRESPDPSQTFPKVS